MRKKKKERKNEMKFITTKKEKYNNSRTLRR